VTDDAIGCFNTAIAIGSPTKYHCYWFVVELSLLLVDLRMPLLLVHLDYHGCPDGRPVIFNVQLSMAAHIQRTTLDHVKRQDRV